MNEQPHLPGRLGDPNSSLETDRRTDPRLAEALAAFGVGGPAAAPLIDLNAPLEERLANMAEVESGLEGFNAALFTDLPPVEGIERDTATLKGVDGNQIDLYISRPKGVSGPLPCIYHIHGGGMVILDASGAHHVRWREELTALGMIVVGVEFRNAAGKLGPHPFPAGLNDCFSGLEWTFMHKADLGISKILVSGESGGGNLALALCQKAKQEGALDQIDGVYALCPCISNAWDVKDPALPSLYENDQYFFHCRTMALIASVYDPEGENAMNPLCWPLRARTEDLRGLPPHVVSVNELDFLRDEGIAYFLKLMAAGVSGYCRTVNGTSHCADQVFRKAIPEVFAATIRDMKGFADTL